MSAIVEMPRPAADVEKRMRAIDTRLEGLRARRRDAETEADRLTHEENRLTRIFAEADSKKEKHEIRGRVDAIAQERADREREMAGLSAAIAEAEEERKLLLPEFEREWKLRAAQERNRKLEQLRQDHEKNLLRVRDCDKALLEARAAADRSFFAWTTFKDQEAISEQLAATERLKEDWQRHSGPNAPGNRR